jgi:cell division cycle protein 37
MLATLFDEVNKTLDERRIERDQRYKGFSQELGVLKIQNLQSELVKKLNALEQQDSNKITSESYHVGFDSSHVTKTTKLGETSKRETKVELLNPNLSLDETRLDTDKKASYHGRRHCRKQRAKDPRISSSQGIRTDPTFRLPR